MKVVVSHIVKEPLDIAGKDGILFFFNFFNFLLFCVFCNIVYSIYSIDVIAVSGGVFRAGSCRPSCV